MKKADPRTIYLKDYKVSLYLIEETELYFDIRDDFTLVESTIVFYHNPKSEGQPGTLVLDGEGLELLEIKVDDQPLLDSSWKQTDYSLSIFNLPEKFKLNTKVRIFPDKNTLLEGLYKTGSNYCTQCEAEGFRRITWYLDRPDVMAPFHVTIEAEQKSCPILLSNGNKVDQGRLGNGRHWICWKDPHNKPAYLFALVAGDYAHLHDKFTTMSGREVDLNIYTEAHNINKTDHAMNSLMHSMRWDEERFGLEYDLDVYNIVATDDFNMGAMENKGLNVFNSKYVLASPESATDTDYIGIEGVIGHEYFHNWTGNRVTCRDWFQLSLKEGLTVFRDQEFTGDMNSAAVKRIEDVAFLRDHQFTEDASPMAHPIRPPSYIEINNFYTMTVYEKGSQVVRIYQSILGKDGFRKGMDLYFKRHDGQAVTTEDFLAAMADANDVDLSLMQRWYDQGGTPELVVKDSWNEKVGEYTLTLAQHTPDTPGQSHKLPVPIPLCIGLIGSTGKDLAIKLKAQDQHDLLLTGAEAEFVFTGLDEKPIPSLLRGYSAPVKVKYDYSREQLNFLALHDSDSFNRWDAGQKLAMDILLQKIKSYQKGEQSHPQHLLTDLFSKVLTTGSEPALDAEMLVLPGMSTLAEEMDVIDVEAIYSTRTGLKAEIASILLDALKVKYEQTGKPEPTALDPESMGKRKFKNIILDYLLASINKKENQFMTGMAWTQFESAGCMTETMGALRPLVHNACERGHEALEQFEQTWKDDALVMDKWFSVQVTAPSSETLAVVENLMSHQLFSMKNPNRVRSVIGAFTGNAIAFHAADGSGYDFLTERVIELNKLNPMIAARLVKSLTRWRRYDEERQIRMKSALERILAIEKLSKDVYEIASKSLDG